MAIRHKFLRALPCAIALLLPLTVGCGSEQPYGTVEGVVTLEGKPLANAEVVFMPDPEKGNKGRRSVALTDKDGRYRIASDTGREGAPVGFHRVCINDMLSNPPGVAPPPVDPDDEKHGPQGTTKAKAQPVPGRPPSPMAETKRTLRFPEEYTSAIDTPLRHEVKPGTQVINLELKKKFVR